MPLKNTPGKNIRKLDKPLLERKAERRSDIVTTNHKRVEDVPQQRSMVTFSEIQQELARKDEDLQIEVRKGIEPARAKLRFEKVPVEFCAEHGALVLLTQEDNNVFYEYNNGVYSEVQNDEILAKLMVHMKNREMYSYLTASRVKDAFQRLQWYMRVEPGRHFVRDDITRRYINFRNTLLDITTMKTTPHTPKYFSMTQLPFDYDPSAKAEKFLNFIEEVSCENQGVVKMLQEMFGYCLNIGNPKHKIFFLYGKTGRNGKSTVAKILQSMVGDRNTSALSLQQLSSDNTHLTVALANSQVNFSEEVSTKYIETTHLTNLTAEGIITINPKNKPPYLMKVWTKFIVTCNDIPQFQSSQGMFKRQIIIPFNNSFEGRENNNIVDELLEESSGIFNWAIEGYQRLNKDGFFVSDVSAEEMDEAKLNNNPIIEYVRALFKFNPASSQRYTVGQLYGFPKEGQELATEYIGWSHLVGLVPLSKKRFAMELRRYAEDSKRFVIRREVDNVYVFGLHRVKTLKAFREDMKAQEYSDEGVQIEPTGIDF